MKYQVDFTALKNGTVLLFDTLEEASDYAYMTYKATQQNEFPIKRIVIHFIYEEDSPDGTVHKDI